MQHPDSSEGKGALQSTGDGTKARSSIYVASSDSDDSDTTVAKSVAKKPSFASKTRQPNKTDVLWKGVTDNVILCGQKSLHCHNTGNLLFRDYIHAAVLLFYKFGNTSLYDKEYVVDEIYSKLMNHEWRKLEDKTQQLNVSEIKRKIRKAIGDRKSKMQQQQLKRLSKVHHSKKIEMQQLFNDELEDQLNVELE